MTVYIITRNRLANLIKIVPRWLVQGFSVALVVEKSEKQDHEEMVRYQRSWQGVSIVCPRQTDKGVGYARRVAVEHATSSGLRSIIMSDDDVMPANDSNMPALLHAATSTDVLGIGAVRSLHDRFSGGVTSRENGIILCPGGWGMQLFALNTMNTIRMGNFDEKLDCFGEDHELMRNGIVNGFPWLVHCGVRCEAIGTRYAPGGLNSFIQEAYGTKDVDLERSQREIVCRRIIYERWPKYVSAPDRRSRTSWQKMMDDYIPYWRELSAIHGGRWQ